VTTPRKKRGYVARGECRASRSCYVMGCDNDVCRRASRLWVTRNRLQRAALGRVTHGTRSGYDTGCRCTGCRQARSDGYRTETLRMLAGHHVRPADAGSALVSLLLAVCIVGGLLGLAVTP
jgi:hypothetical protein